MALILACLGFAVYERASFRAAMSNELLGLADTLGANTAASLTFNDRKSARDMLGALQAERQITATCLYDIGERFSWRSALAHYVQVALQDVSSVGARNGQRLADTARIIRNMEWKFTHSEYEALRMSAIQHVGRRLGVKKERGDCSPLSSVTKANSLPSVLPFCRKKPTATKFRGVVPWFALRRPPSLGLTRLRNANTGLNPAEPRHDCHLLPCLAEAFHPPPSRVARQVFACRATQDQFVWSASTTRF